IPRPGREPLGGRIALLVGGVALIGPATAFYIGADFGAGPRDTLMLVGARPTHARVAVVRTALQLSALVAGIVLGGTFGAGTLLFALGVGPCVEASFRLLEKSPLVRIETTVIGSAGPQPKGGGTRMAISVEGLAA